MIWIIVLICLIFVLCRQSGFEANRKPTECEIEVDLGCSRRRCHAGRFQGTSGKSLLSSFRSARSRVGPCGSC